MIRFTNSSTPEIITELQTLLNQLERVNDNALESFQRKTRIELTKMNPFERNPNCELSPFVDFIQHLVLNTQTQKIELLDFVEIRDRLVYDKLIYFGKTSKELRHKICSKIREFHKEMKLLSDSQNVTKRECLIAEIKILLEEFVFEKIKTFIVNYSETIDFLVAHNISITPKSFNRRSFFSHLLKLIDDNCPEVLAFKTNKADIQLKTLFHKNFLRRQLEEFDFLNSQPLEVQSLTVTEKRTLLDFIDFLSKHSFAENNYVFSSLEILGKAFGDDLNNEVFWVPLLQQLKRDEEKLVRERKLPESNITHKSKISSFISICERIAHNDFEQSLASLPYFKLLSEGVHKLRFII
jgi:hypothetical protein